MTTKKKARSRIRRYHPFEFTRPAMPGIEEQTFKIKCRVVLARQAVNLTLEEEDIVNSIKADGVGNTQLCAMAMCARRQKHDFPHPYEGYIDWYYSTAYVVSKRSKETGLPIECVKYEHHDGVARLNDSAKGQRTLLAKVKKEGGIEIRLVPPRQRIGESKKGGTGRVTGERSARSGLGSGSNLRFAVALAGRILPKDAA